MASSTNKKVVIRRFDREPLTGFVNPQTYLSSQGVELLTPSGTVTVLPFAEVKAVCFVKDFAPEAVDQRHQFTHRPKTAGLWIRMSFRDQECWDGLLPNNLMTLEEFGFTVIPPDLNANSQRLFVPKAALTGVQVLAVVGSPLRASRSKSKSKIREQLEMFD